MTREQIIELVDNYAIACVDLDNEKNYYWTVDSSSVRFTDDAREAVIAALEALTKDATRYQAIRNGTTIYTVDREYDTGIGPMIEAVLFEELDNEIDAAIAAQKEQS